MPSVETSLFHRLEVLGNQTAQTVESMDAFQKLLTSLQIRNRPQSFFIRALSSLCFYSSLTNSAHRLHSKRHIKVASDARIVLRERLHQTLFPLSGGSVIWVTVQWASVTTKPVWFKVKREVMDLDNAAKAINELRHRSPAGCC